MDFVNVRELRINTGQTWERLEKEKELIITSNGKPIALMAGITGKNLETILAAVRKARGEAAVRELHTQSLEKGLDHLDDEVIEAEIKKARRERKRR
ncbi:MAG: type II toxin-antitoxin system Phd/YefM family antitoxin [Deltaproteobacteria bacterium]|nr:type II toxin-antitoxin system Phd/YefM family antitoxin [Deltaproteobacteria bacterium]